MLDAAELRKDGHVDKKQEKRDFCQQNGVLPLEWTVLNKLIRLCSFITAGLYFYAAVA